MRYFRFCRFMELFGCLVLLAACSGGGGGAATNSSQIQQDLDGGGQLLFPPGSTDGDASAIVSAGYEFDLSDTDLQQVGTGVSLDLQNFNDAELVKVSLPVEQGVDPNSLEIVRIDELGEFLRLQTEFSNGRLEAWSPGFRADLDVISKRDGPATVSFVPALKPSNVILDAEIYGPDFLPLGAGASYIEPVSLFNQSRLYSFDWVAIGESENNRGVVARSKTYGFRFAPSKEGRYLIGLTITDSATGLSRFFSKVVTVLADDSVAPVADAQLFLMVEGDIKTRETLVYTAILMGVPTQSVDFVFETAEGDSQIVTGASNFALAEASFSTLKAGDFTVTVMAELADGTVLVAQRTVDIPSDGLEYEIARIDTLSDLSEVRDATSTSDIFSKLAADIILDIQDAAPSLFYQFYNSGRFAGEGQLNVASLPSTQSIQTTVFPGVNRFRVELDDEEKFKVRFVQKTLLFNPLTLQSSLSADRVDVGQVVDLQGLLSGGVFKGARPEDEGTGSRYRIRVQWGDGSRSDDYLPVSLSQGLNLAINEAVPLAQHVYQEAGEYTIEVTLQDFSGKTVTNQLNIEVRDESAEPTPEPTATPAATVTPPPGNNQSIDLSNINKMEVYATYNRVVQDSEFGSSGPTEKRMQHVSFTEPPAGSTGGGQFSTEGNTIRFSGQAVFDDSVSTLTIQLDTEVTINRDAGPPTADATSRRISNSVNDEGTESSDEMLSIMRLPRVIYRDGGDGVLREAEFEAFDQEACDFISGASDTRGFRDGGTAVSQPDISCDRFSSVRIVLSSE